MQTVRKEPFVHLLECEKVEVMMSLVFHAHYGEPPLVQTLSVSKGQGE